MTLAELGRAGGREYRKTAGVFGGLSNLVRPLFGATKALARQPQMSKGMQTGLDVGVGAGLVAGAGYAGSQTLDGINKRTPGVWPVAKATAQDYLSQVSLKPGLPK